MRVILNSDILHDEQLVVDELSVRLRTLFRVCAERGHTITVPLTALLEFERHQMSLVNERIRELQKAYDMLEKSGVAFTWIAPTELIKPPALVKLIEKCGVGVDVETPTFEDFFEAHRRACLHEPPQPPDSRTDEMRDLVVWIVAVRLAAQGEGALLISRDVVHTHARGDDEAARARLARVAGTEDALEYFDVLTPMGRLFEQLLSPLWEDLISTGLPVSKNVSMIGISQTRFIRGTHGFSFARGVLKVRTSDGKTLRTVIEIDMSTMGTTRVALSGIAIEGMTWTSGHLEIISNKAMAIEKDDFVERLTALRALLEEQT